MSQTSNLTNTQERKVALGTFGLHNLHPVAWRLGGCGGADGPRSHRDAVGGPVEVVVDVLQRLDGSVPPRYHDGVGVNHDVLLLQWARGGKGGGSWFRDNIAAMVLRHRPPKEVRSRKAPCWLVPTQKMQ